MDSTAGMAIYHFHAKYISHSNGGRATAAAAYRAGVKIQDEMTGETYDYTRKSGVYHSEILAPANAPAWVYNRAQLWNTAEKADTRINSRTAQEFDIALPVELTHAQKIELVRTFVQKEFVWKGVVADVAFHDFEGKHKHNPHAHILITTRFISGDKLGKKTRDWEHKQQITIWRQAWADHANREFARLGLEVRIDHRTLEEQGIDREATRHEGKRATGLRKRNMTPDNAVSERNDQLRQLKAYQNELATLQHQLHVAEREAEEQSAAPAPEQDNLQETPEVPVTVPSRMFEVSKAQEITSAVTASLHPEPQLEHRSPSAAPPSPVVAHGETHHPSDQPKRQGRDPNEPKDRTWQSVKRQLEAMRGDGRFEIGIGTRDPETGKITHLKTRHWSKDEILRYDPDTKRTPILSYLKAENVQGKDLYIRLAPTEDGKQQGLILIDDIGVGSLNRLEQVGLKPAVVMQTSQMNWQAWVRVGNEPLHRDEASQLAKLLAREFGGDSGSASFQHYGRLAGFTNRKPEHIDERGRHPYVRLEYEDSTGEQATDGAAWLARAREDLALRKAQEAQVAAPYGQRGQRRVSKDEKERALNTFVSIVSEYTEKYGLKDTSALDWAVCKRMAKRGWREDALAYALRYGSPDLEKRKAGHEADYVNRTLQKIFANPEVLQAIAEREEKRRQRQQPSQPAKPEPVQASTTPKIVPDQESQAIPRPTPEDQRDLIEQMKWLNDGKERGRQERRREPEIVPVGSPADTTPANDNPPVTDQSASQREKAKALTVFRKLYASEFERYPVELLDDLDALICGRMVERKYSANALTYALKHGSADLSTRKGKNLETYVQRTVETAFADERGFQKMIQQQERNKRVERQRRNIRSVSVRPALNDNTPDAAKREPQLPEKPDSTQHQSPLQPLEQTPDPRKTPVFWASYYRWERSQGYTPPYQETTDPGTAHIQSPSPYTAQALGDLDAETVAALKHAAHTSTNAKAQLRKADWLLQNPELVEAGGRYAHWNPCKREYLRELARIHRAHGKEAALDPHTDLTIAVKLRLAGFTHNQINKALVEASPVGTSLPSVEHQTVYLQKAIKPTLVSPRMRETCEVFHRERVHQAEAITDPVAREAFLRERRLDRLGLATPTDRQRSRDSQEPER